MRILFRRDSFFSFFLISLCHSSALKFLCCFPPLDVPSDYCNPFDIPAPIFDIIVLFLLTTPLEIQVERRYSFIQTGTFTNLNFNNLEEDASLKESLHRFVVIIDIR